MSSQRPGGVKRCAPNQAGTATSLLFCCLSMLSRRLWQRKGITPAKQVGYVGLLAVFWSEMEGSTGFSPPLLVSCLSAAVFRKLGVLTLAWHKEEQVYK